ncbi:MAG: hypothetical protein KBD67_06685 [Anaerolineaceae bacterium]|nr:hypothetical protein [Anaerolineaceae bacterium]
MQWLRKRYQFLFRSTKGLILVAIAFAAIISALFGMLSGPMADYGVKEVVVRALRMTLEPAQREGRLIILYHTLAMITIAVEVYMITDLLKMKDSQRLSINTAMTVGYLMVIFGGLPFAYWGFNWIFHGIYISGLAIIFFTGCLLLAALWPWQKETYLKTNEYARTKKGVDLERVAFFMVALSTMISALFGAIPGSFFGNGFETFLAENVVREPHKTVLDLSIIGHLHIMLALISLMCALIIGRWMDFKGFWQKLAMPFYIAGAFVLALGTWLVVPFENLAHFIIYGGSTVAMLGALFLVIDSWRKIIRTGLDEKGIKKGTFFQSVSALTRDPVRFGPTWQMVFMNFTVSGIGIFTAVKLDEIFRQWQYMDERTILTGHWHILATLTATILLLYYSDLAGIKGKARQWFGWSVIIFSNLAFGAVTLYEMKRLIVTEGEQQPFVNKVVLAGDVGLIVLLVALAAIMGWRLIDLFKKKGRWFEEIPHRLPKKEEVQK